MYSVYARIGNFNVCLHDDTVANTSVKLYEPVLTLEDNSAGSFEFSMLPNNNGYEPKVMQETYAVGITDGTPVDILSDLELGGISDSGSETIDNTRLRTPFYDLTIGSAGVSVDPIAYNTIQIKALLSEETTEEHSEKWLVTSSILFNTAKNMTRVNANIDRTKTDFQYSFQNGNYENDSSRAPNDNMLCCGLIRASEVYFALEIGSEKPCQWRVWAFNSDREMMGISDWRDSGDHGKFSYYGAMVYYGIEIRYGDKSQIRITDLTYIKSWDDRVIQWAIKLYDSNDEQLEASEFFDVGQPIEMYNANQAKCKIWLRFKNGDDLSLNQITTATFSASKKTMWRLEMYDNNEFYLGHGEWTSELQRCVVTEADAKKIRLQFAFYDNSTISTSEYNSCHYTEHRVETRTVDYLVDIVARMQSTITVNRLERVWNQDRQDYDYKEKRFWEGRVLLEEGDFNKVRKIYCEGELAYLNDTCQPQKNYGFCTLRQFIEAVFDNHNARVSDNKKFYVGSVYITDADAESSIQRVTQYEKTMETLNSIIDEFDCHIKLRFSDGKRYVDFYKDLESGRILNQTIKFGQNLLDYTSKWDLSQLCTVILPLGTMTSGTNPTAGDPLPLNGGDGPTPCQLLYLDDTTKEVYIQAGPNLAGYYTAVAQVEPEKNYYFSGRLHGGFVAYTVKGNADGSGDYYDGCTKTAGTASQVGFVDFIDTKITIPAGAHSVVMCGFGSDIPLCLKDEKEGQVGLDSYVTIENVDTDEGWHEKGSLYIIDQEAVSKYGWIEKQLPLDSVNNEKVLYDTAKVYLQSGQFDSVTLELTAMDMNLLGVKSDYISILDQIRVISEPHGIDRLFPVTKLEIPLDKPAETKFTLGTEYNSSLTEVNNSINDDILAKIAATPSMSQTLESAKANAAQMISSATSGYVTLREETDPNTGKSIVREIIIANGPDYTDATGIWRWNENGLCYSNGYDPTQHDLRAAITADGKIVADYITTGTLKAINIEGCIIKVGVLDNTPGEIYILDGNNSDSCVCLDHGKIGFGTYSDDTYTEHADIKGDLWYEGQGQSLPGVRIKADVLALDADHLWVGSKAGGDTAEAISTTIGVLDSNGAVLNLHFVNGILVGTTP